MKEIQHWPDDSEFRRFAAKLADAVMARTASGWEFRSSISPRRHSKCCCPLGALVGTTYPTSDAIQIAPHLGNFDADEFIRGFDLGVRTPSPYNRLGRAYRERFVRT